MSDQPGLWCLGDWCTPEEIAIPQPFVNTYFYIKSLNRAIDAAAMSVIAEVQKAGGEAAFIDAEHALDPVYAKALGVDINNLLVSQPDCGEDALEICEALARSGAVDAIVIDYFHWTEQGNWEFEPSLWPDPKAMCDELYSMGIRPVVSIWPTINPASHNWNAMNDENMLLRTENGQYGTFDFYGQQTFIDPTNPRTREYVWEQVKKGYYQYGIKTFCES